MTKRIYRGILLSSVITMLACLIFTIGIQYQMYDESTKDSLKDKAYIISLNSESGDLSKYADAKERITLITSSGKVLFDNKAIADKMENHLSRKEVKGALDSGEGYAVRRSETLGSKSCYYALKLKNGNILRISDDSLTVWTVLINLLPAICAIAIMTLVLSSVLAAVISKKILKPLNSIDLENPDAQNVYDELIPFINKINMQNRKIDRQIARLTRSRREFDIITENMSEGLVLTDIKGNILTHNKGIEKFFGVGEDINGKNILTLNRSEVFREIFSDITEKRRGEDILSLNGRYYDMTANPVYDEDGTPCGAVILAVDITEKEKREKLRREFTANVSHELKTPLTSISGISDMLMNGIVAPEDIKGFAGDINKESARLITLVNDIIKLSELDEGAYSTETDEKVNLLKTAAEVKERLEAIAAKKNVKIAVTGEDSEITGGESLVFEMLYNLCDNAVKYNKENGNVTVSVGTIEGAPFVTVKDTGIGIPPEYTDRIFERFFRVDKSRSKESGGTGLGLSIVKHIAMSLGADIRVESAVGKGTEITVTFNNK
ncbi:MAG TPA: hypothetical protein DDY61_08135 [Ruminococcaceae bacterium]|nr:hypothetical protein [Oscillospiraceae bacterium]